MNPRSFATWAAAGAVALWFALAAAAEPDGSASDAGKTPVAESDAAKPWNGFDVANASVPVDKLVAGGPRRDAIRSVDQPEFADPDEAHWVAPTSVVVGLRVGDIARAYPVHLLEYHQIVNDDFAGVAVVLSYDPLTGSPLAYKRKVDGRTLEFGVSGLVYQSNFLLFDRETESLWLQWSGEAIAGPMLGKRMEGIRVRQEPQAGWLARHPNTSVLARPMLKQIDYRYSPYSAYWGSQTIPFPVDTVDSTYHPKEVVVGLRAKGKSRAYLGSLMVRAGGRVVDDFEGRKVRIAYDTETATFSWEIPEDLVVREAYWFAWKTFQPATEVWQGVELSPPPPEASQSDGGVSPP